MANILRVVSAIFNSIFVGSDSSIRFIINRIVGNAYTLIGVTLLIVGFSVGVIKRIIHS